MSTEIKQILIMVVICATIVFSSIVWIGQSNPMSNNENIATSIDITSVISPQEEIIEESQINNSNSNINEELSKQPNPEENEVSGLQNDNGNVPENNGMKTYMDYRCITSTGSQQYKLQHTIAYTGDYGLRMVGDRYCVAVGSYYTTTIGQHLDIELENGIVINGILADCKSDEHTDETNRIHFDGSVVEFVVDIDLLDETAKMTGDISWVNGWDSKVVNITVYDVIEEF